VNGRAIAHKTQNCGVTKVTFLTEPSGKVAVFVPKNWDPKIELMTEMGRNITAMTEMVLMM
jgi:hypothetical protein